MYASCKEWYDKNSPIGVCVSVGSTRGRSWRRRPVGVASRWVPARADTIDSRVRCILRSGRQSSTHLGEVVRRRSGDIDAVCREDLFHIRRVHRELGLAHDPHLGPDPGDQDELGRMRPVLSVVAATEAVLELTASGHEPFLGPTRHRSSISARLRVWATV